jgi:hypothetical protein
MVNESLLKSMVGNLLIIGKKIYFFEYCSISLGIPKVAKA